MTDATHFDAGWLQLREPIDHRSRAPGLEHRLMAALAGTARLSVLDLGSGCGSNLRHLAPRLDRPQHWTLLDHDRGLLDQARQSLPDLEGLTTTTRCLDLADPSTLDLPRPDLVTASAWLDLVSADWIDGFAACLSSWRRRP
jgi:trans-aconitate methyltransferase